MLLSILFFFKCLFFTPDPAPATDVPKSIYDFKVEALTGGTVDFSKYKGQKILIVNTASECGNTPQYADLEALYKKYKGKLVIVGFPANNFGAQEPGSNKQIAEFCQKNYSVSFPMCAKISVKGDDMAPIYHWLTDEKYNNFKSSEVRWNFQKYLLNEKGELVAVFDPRVKPMDPAIIAALEK
jgi:glutathione peroxidase